MRWLERSFDVGMPHLIPGQLSEVELLKVLGDAQWHAISTLLGRPSERITNDQGERLYASFISIDLAFGSRNPMELGEGARIHVRHAARFFSRRFVEGFFCFNDAPITEASVEGIGTKQDLESTGLPWLYVTNAFVTREDSNSRLRTFAPAGAENPDAESTDMVPEGIRDHEQAERTGTISVPRGNDAVPMATRDQAGIAYTIVPESDLNGAGLFYFARYLAVANYGERLFLRHRSAVELSAPLIRSLATSRRRICYFANANESDRVNVTVSGYVSRPASPTDSSTTVSPLQFFFVTELRRESDGVVMARAAVHKVLRLSRRDKSLILEAARIGQEMGLPS